MHASPYTLSWTYIKTQNGQVNNTIMFTLVCSYTYVCMTCWQASKGLTQKVRVSWLARHFNHGKTIHDDMYGSHQSGCMQENRVGVQKSERTSEKASIFV